MKAPHIARQLSRRRFLSGAGAFLALPILGSFTPVFGREKTFAPPQRMLLISNNLGVLPTQFFPTKTGRGYEASPYLATLGAFRDDFTVFSGLSHPDVTGGHSTENCFLTAARGPTKSGFRNQISLDQFAAEKIGQVTRLPTLNLGVNIDKANRSLSWTRDGVLLPAEDSASALFRRMFLQGNPAEVARQLHRLEERGSILDTLLDDTKRYARDLDGEDRTRLDQYLTSVREVEARLRTAREWELRPESDSTRIVTLMVDAFATPVFKLHPDQNTTDGYHNLSHHGQSVEKVRQLKDADQQQMTLLAKVLGRLTEHREADQRLLDRTMVLFGSNLGDANTHDNTNLPILLAGGGFKHGQHLAFRRDQNTPLCNLYVSMLQKMGVDADAFGSSTGPLAGLS